jgi:hypothetical protein
MLSTPGYSGAPPPGSLPSGAQVIHGPYGYQIVGVPSFQAAASLSGLDSVPSSGGGPAGGPAQQADESSAAGSGVMAAQAGPPPTALATTVNTISNNNNISNSHQHVDKGQAN